MKIKHGIITALSSLSLMFALVAPQTFAQQPQYRAADIPLDYETIYTEFAPESAYSETTRNIISQLIRNHYLDIVFDDAFSSRMLDSYIKMLDPTRIHFTQQDLDEFEQYRHDLDELLQKGDLDAGFAIYNRYHQRLVERLLFNLEWLEEQQEPFDFTVDESMVVDRSEEPWAENEDALRDLWRQRLKSNFLTLKLAQDETAAAAALSAAEAEVDPAVAAEAADEADADSALAEATPEESTDTVWEQLSKRFRTQLSQVLKTKELDVFQRYMDAMTQTFDPHTQYYAPRAAENFNMNMRLSLEGIGAVLTTRDEYTEVVSIVTGGPADLAGELKPADRITAVAQGDQEFVDVIGWRVDDVVQLIRGEKGTVVRLNVLSKNGLENRVVSITRDTVKLEEQSAQKDLVTIDRDGESYRVGVIRLPTFYIDFEALQRRDPDYRSSSRDVRRLLLELQEEGIDGVIVDLRGNGGGSLSEANALAGLFIRTGATVQVRDADGNNVVQGDSNPEIVYDGPLTVLVDHLSASASEIFAGAMQDYGRGLILGSQTFGKGTVQELVPMKEGQIKLTRAKFYRVSGESTQHKGVMPDIPFPNVLDATKELGESALPNALPWDTIAANYYRPYGDLSPYIPELLKRHDARIETDPDFVYIRAQIERIRENQERNEMPLSEEKMIAEREANNAWRLATENARRQGKGEQPFEDVQTMDSSLNEEEDVDAYADENGDPIESDSALSSSDEEDADKDPYLVESAEVIIDLLEMLAAQRLSQAG